MKRYDGRGAAWLWVSALMTLLAMSAGIVLAPSGSDPPALVLTWLLFLGSSVHVAATGYLFTVPEVRNHARTHPGRYVVVPTCLTALAVLVAGVLSPSHLSWLLLVYFCWQFLHFQKQNLGMVALAASTLGVKGPGPAERRLLLLAGWTGIVGLAAHPALLQLRLATHLGAAFNPALGGAMVALTGGVIALLRRRPSDRPPGFSVVYLSSLAFFLPIFVFPSPYAAVAGVTIAHGLQYILLVGVVAGNGRESARTFRIAAFVNIALVGGIFLATASHLHGGPTAARLIFGAYLGVVMAHFVVDAGLWRLRDPFPRSFLSARVPYLVPRSHPFEIPVDDRSVADIG
jgi:hypothetical protein